jgi:uncharacterized protein (TIGR03435 family)
MTPLVKNLLLDRFKLKVHTEPREMQVYDLVIARSDGRLGPDLKPSTSDCSKTDELNATRADALAKGDLSAVVIAKPGQVLTCTIAPNLSGGPLNISMHGDGQEIKQLIEVLTQLTGRYVRDKTGLTGRYDFDMKLDLQALVAMAQAMGMNVPRRRQTSRSRTAPADDGAQRAARSPTRRAPPDVVVVDRPRHRLNQVAVSDGDLAPRRDRHGQMVVDVNDLSRRSRARSRLCPSRHRGPGGGLVGANGAGKTTLIKHLLGLPRATTGLHGPGPTRFVIRSACWGASAISEERERRSGCASTS